MAEVRLCEYARPRRLMKNVVSGSCSGSWLSFACGESGEKEHEQEQEEHLRTQFNRLLDHHVLVSVIETATAQVELAVLFDKVVRLALHVRVRDAAEAGLALGEVDAAAAE